MGDNFLGFQYNASRLCGFVENKENFPHPANTLPPWARMQSFIYFFGVVS
jgi:hypothetical protein